MLSKSEISFETSYDDFGTAQAGTIECTLLGKIIIFALDEGIASVLRNEIYSKTGRRRLGSLFPFISLGRNLDFEAGAERTCFSVFLRRQISKTIFLRHLLGSVQVYEK
jgi:hypothetical protein